MADNLYQRRGRGMALFQFAVVVLLLGVVGSCALEGIAHLKASADGVQAQTHTAQQRSLNALREARGLAVSCPVTAASAPLTVSLSCP